MRFLLHFLLLQALYASFSFACDNFRCCLRKTINVHNPVVINPTKVSESGKFYRVLGVTPDCHLFYGWLHEIMDSNRPHHHQNINISDDRCARKSVAFIKTTGIFREMIFLIDFIGHRIRLQNAMTGSATIDENKDLVWVKVNPNDRWESIYTGPVDHGFKVEHFFNANYRVLVLARSPHTHRVYELKVHVDKDNMPRAYLRRQYNDINPLIIPPLEKVIGRVIHYKEDNRTTSAVVLVPQPLRYSPTLTDFAAIPMTSLLSNTMRKIKFYNGEQLIYQSKDGYFSVKTDKQCERLFHSFMFYFELLEKNSKLSSRWASYSISTRRSLNVQNHHRRMSFPHVRKRQNPVNIRDGWKWPPLIFLGFMVAITVSVTGLQQLTSFVQRKLKKKDSTSSSTTTKIKR